MLSNKERDTIKAKALELGFTEELSQKISKNAEYLELSYDKGYFLLFSFDWDESPEGYDYWGDVYTSICGEIQPTSEVIASALPVVFDEQITQSEKQQLLSILRERLKDAVWGRDLHKTKAAHFWCLAEKGTTAGEFNFSLFSEMNSAAKKHKKEVNKISNLIKKVKAI